MSKTPPYVITISRQLGSGAAYIGRRLALRLNALYLDHEIVRQAAQELKIPEEHVGVRDEKVTSRWESILKTMGGASEWSHIASTPDTFTDKELYKTESDIITRIANERTAVIVGRGGYYVLRQHPRCLSVFLHADVNFRQKRVEEIYHVSAHEALELINSIDRQRADYLKTLTGQNWLDARQYHLCLDASAVGLDKAETIILETLQAQFNNIETGVRIPK